MTRASLDIVHAETDADRAACIDVRREVYIIGMGIDEAEEIDGRDPECAHFLARLDGAPVGTARLMIIGDAAKIQRVAVVEAARGQGIARQLMEAIIAHVRAHTPCTAVKLSANVRALPLYERLGFVAYGAIYDDVGLPHQDMTLALP
ncbi:MAG: GNAT family N-acetyltransferase [Pseudomonadota bacterium]